MSTGRKLVALATAPYSIARAMLRCRVNRNVGQAVDKEEKCSQTRGSSYPSAYLGFVCFVLGPKQRHQHPLFRNDLEADDVKHEHDNP